VFPQVTDVNLGSAPGVVRGNYYPLGPVAENLFPAIPILDLVNIPSRRSLMS
jgi:hypothetical protein